MPRWSVGYRRQQQLAVDLVVDAGEEGRHEPGIRLEQRDGVGRDGVDPGQQPRAVVAGEQPVGGHGELRVGHDPVERRCDRHTVPDGADAQVGERRVTEADHRAHAGDVGVGRVAARGERLGGGGEGVGNELASRRGVRQRADLGDLGDRGLEPVEHQGVAHERRHGDRRALEDLGPVDRRLDGRPLDRRSFDRRLDRRSFDRRPADHDVASARRQEHLDRWPSGTHGTGRQHEVPTQLHALRASRHPDDDLVRLGGGGAQDEVAGDGAVDELHAEPTTDELAQHEAGRRGPAASWPRLAAAAGDRPARPATTKTSPLARTRSAWRDVISPTARRSAFNVSRCSGGGGGGGGSADGGSTPAGTKSVGSTAIDPAASLSTKRASDGGGLRPVGGRLADEPPRRRQQPAQRRVDGGVRAARWG